MHKLLIADDELDVLNSLSNRLKKEGFFVSTARDGQEALDLALAVDGPDILILDIEMPKKNGFEVLKELRESNIKHNQWQPVIILSAKSDFDDIKKGYGLEADFYITKPFNFQQLLKGIETMITLLSVRRIEK
ncbi:MAG: response regulator [Candidatus Gygaella obscura]|nr:response regulator [Candidatus Gygaella obscura]